jgi:hypothetical protein
MYFGGLVNYNMSKSWAMRDSARVCRIAKLDGFPAPVDLLNAA